MDLRTRWIGLVHYLALCATEEEDMGIITESAAIKRGQ